jgi:hypothetical protein
MPILCHVLQDGVGGDGSEAAEAEAQAWRERRAAPFQALMDSAGVQCSIEIITEPGTDPVKAISDSICRWAALLVCFLQCLECVHFAAPRDEKQVADRSCCSCDGCDYHIMQMRLPFSIASLHFSGVLSW